MRRLHIAQIQRLANLEKNLTHKVEFHAPELEHRPQDSAITETVLKKTADLGSGLGAERIQRANS